MTPLPDHLYKFKLFQSSAVSRVPLEVSLTTLATPSHILLIDYLAVHHRQLDADLSTFDLISDTFRQFSVFLADEQDVADWLPTLRRYGYGLMDRLDRPHWQVDWCMRSSDFAQMASRVLA